jgi:hypothetical protein
MTKGENRFSDYSHNLQWKRRNPRSEPYTYPEVFKILSRSGLSRSLGNCLALQCANQNKQIHWKLLVCAYIEQCCILLSPAATNLKLRMPFSGLFHWQEKRLAGWKVMHQKVLTENYKYPNRKLTHSALLIQAWPSPSHWAGGRLEDQLSTDSAPMRPDEKAPAHSRLESQE